MKSIPPQSKETIPPEHQLTEMVTNEERSSSIDTGVSRKLKLSTENTLSQTDSADVTRSEINGTVVMANPKQSPDDNKLAKKGKNKKELSNDRNESVDPKFGIKSRKEQTNPTRKVKSLYQILLLHQLQQ